MQNRPEQYITEQTFHPLFLYESIWNLLGVGSLLLVDRRFKIRPPGLFALYVAWYTAFRTYEETLRIDPSHRVFRPAPELLRLRDRVGGLPSSPSSGRSAGARRRRALGPPLGGVTVPKGRVRR